MKRAGSVSVASAAVLFAVAIAAAGCAGSTTVPGATAVVATPSAVSTPAADMVTPDAAEVCGGIGLQYARSIGPDAQMYSGTVATVTELADWQAERLGATNPGVVTSSDLVTLCYYTDVPSAAPHPQPADGVDIPYTVLGVIVDAAGTADTYSLGPEGSEGSDGLPGHVGQN